MVNMLKLGWLNWNIGATKQQMRYLEFTPSNFVAVRYKIYQPQKYKCSMQVQPGMSSSTLDRLSGFWYVFLLYEFMSTSTRPQLHVKMVKKEKQ